METGELLKKIDLRAMAEEAGAHFNARNSSACPLHGGNNPTAFHIYIGNDGRQRWHCFTNCPEEHNDGDAISFWMAWKKVDFATAWRELCERYGGGYAPLQQQQRQPDNRLPAPEPLPAAEWMARAQSFALWAQEQLWGAGGAVGLEYLRRRRGLRDETIHAALLGWNPIVLKDNPERWGLSTDGPIWLHAGVTIPHRSSRNGEEVQGMKIRCFNGGRAVEGAGKKYRGPRGGRMALYGAELWHGWPILLLVEGEFDCLLAWQEIGDLADVATLAGAKSRLDTRDAMALLEKVAVIAIYDADEAGRQGGAAIAMQWPRAMQVPPPDHDLTDYWQHGGNLRGWLAGVLAAQYERLLDGLDSGQQAEVFVQWLGEYEKCALAARS